MAKFIVLAREAFTDLVRGLKSSAIKSSGKKNTDVSGMLRLFNERRGAIQRSYQKATGKELPSNKIAIPEALYERLKSTKSSKGSFETSMEYGSIVQKPVKGFRSPERRAGGRIRSNPDFKNGEDYLRQRQSEEGY